MIDSDGFRPNVAIVIMKDDSQVFWAHRCNNDGWQFPQGGMRSDETPVEAMYRELHEETGLAKAENADEAPQQAPEDQGHQHRDRVQPEGLAHGIWLQHVADHELKPDR